jgi:uncharacterized membrane protein
MRDKETVIAFFIIITILTSSVVWISVNPRPSEQFMAIFTLGENGMAEHYYPNDNPNLKLDELVHWYVGVYNHMDSIELISIRFKLLNATLPAPDDQTHTPSPASAFTEIQHLLLNNETWIIPISWEITYASLVNDSIVINTVSMNGAPITSNLAVSAQGGRNFRIIIELWTFEPETQQYGFGWETQNETRVVWNQIWFNATLTNPK